MSVVTVNGANFDTLVKQSEKPVLLDFWAPWCGPCRMVSPILEQIAGTREDILVGKINVDEEMSLAMEFGIVSIPTLVVMKAGAVCARAVGYMSREEILDLLK